jgi:hypothetical protein
MHPSWTSYLDSLGKELLASQDRVRNLIGDRHWLSDGHHKEAVIRGVLGRHLPIGVTADRGFVLSPDEPENPSREQDLLLVDTFVEAPLLQQGGITVTLPSNVLAAVSVKSTLTVATLKDAIAGLATVLQAAGSHAPRLWSGAFFYEESPKIVDATRLYAKVISAIRNGAVCTADLAAGVARRADW